MTKQIRLKLSRPKSHKYKKYKRCVCYNLTKQFGNGNLYIVFLPDELNGITIPKTRCTFKNCERILNKYFEKVTIIKII